MRTRRLMVTSISVASTLAGPALADHTNTAEVTVSPNSGGGSGPYHGLQSGFGAVNASGSASGNGGSAGTASSHVDYGLITGSASATGSLTSVTRGIIHDSITITAPGVPTGTPGTLTYSVTLTGGLSASAGQSTTTWQLQADVGGGSFDIFRSGGTRSPELPPAGAYGDAFGLYQATISFQYGFAMTLDIELTGSAAAVNSFNGPGEASFSSPLHLTWGGVSNVTANGAGISSFVLVSESGSPWEHPLGVPTCGTADFNCDGDVGTDADIESFFACLAGTCPPAPCRSSADFNADGDTGTDADIEAFFRVLAGGSC